MLNQSFQETNKFSISSKLQWVIVIISIAMSFVACNKTDNYQSDALSDYMPLQIGKYWIYQLDSTNYINSQKIITHYQAKDVVDSQLVDNLNRPTYSIIRYIRPADSTSETSWKLFRSYYITPTRQTLETIDFYNFKYQSLKLPIAMNFTWKGNTYLPQSPYSEALPVTVAYNFTVDNNMADWDYTYTGIGETVTVNGKSYNNVVTVTQADYSTNLQPDNQTPVGKGDFATRAYSVEQYAKGIGLLTKKFELWEYQPNNNGYYVGFAIQLQLIDHN